MSVASGWEVRYEGSPQSRGGLTDREVLDGVRDGSWEPTDEVRGPGETAWRPLERHPHFAAALEDYEPPMKPEPEDETRLDMNPLIDVALVLLVFFMLTTTYELLRKTLPLPGASPTDTKAPPVRVKDLEKTTILVRASKDEAGKPVVRVEDAVVPVDRLTEAIAARVKDSKKQGVLIDARDVPWGVVVAIMDAAAAARVERTMFAVPVKDKPK